MRLARLIASGFGSGFAPAAPGTAGSLAALAVGALLLRFPPALPIVLGATVVGGTWAVRRAGGGGDPGWVVIDEFAGQFVTLLAVPRPTVPALLAAFALFRALDIVKPGPIGWLDRPGALGVMADDLAAGAIAAILLWGVQARWPMLLG